jgi:hypothetical protein
MQTLLKKLRLIVICRVSLNIVFLIEPQIFNFTITGRLGETLVQLAFIWFDVKKD